jgi:hypothetical protein
MNGAATVGWLVAGGVAGSLHFALLRWNVRLLTGHTRAGEGNQASAAPISGAARLVGPAIPRGGSVRPWLTDGPVCARTVQAFTRADAPPSSASDRLRRAARRRTVAITLLTLLRLPATIALLWLVAMQGTWPLLLMAAGILLVRPIVVRWAT